MDIVCRLLWAQVRTHSSNTASNDNWRTCRAKVAGVAPRKRGEVAADFTSPERPAKELKAATKSELRLDFQFDAPAKNLTCRSGPIPSNPGLREDKCGAKAPQQNGDGSEVLLLTVSLGGQKLSLLMRKLNSSQVF